MFDTSADPFYTNPPYASPAINTPVGIEEIYPLGDDEFTDDDFILDFE